MTKPTFAFLAYLLAFVAIVALAVCAVIARGAQTPVVMRGPIMVSWTTAEPKMGPDRSYIKWVVKGEYSVVVIEPSGDARVDILATIEKDLLSGTDGVFVDNKFYPDRLVARLTEELLMREYKKTFPGPLIDDERTRLVRP